ncbi:hypothetical protein LPB86_13955 [Pedobacter sp. MC2016-14]|uniref:hypothetical protein n=1 Tax=Pedobacter sp. MC2016-14 TaxID=2897327 RepID=UPI001E5D2842|nr:hypothetical protein [Pedobacter sp. MC2016-14]MCD0489341.1 hypothetical protein [Pedobacter sp. MC2016-14]
MKNKNFQKLLFGAICILSFSSCKKDTENIFTMFDDVTVTYNNSDPRCVTDYKLVNDGEEVWIDYTINSASEDMYSIIVEKSAGAAQNGTYERTTVVISDNNRRRSYSDIIKFTMSRDGKTSYRICALNKKGTFIGDGYKKVTIEQNPSYTIIANKNIYLPDTVAKVLPSFFSLRDGTTYSYTNGAANASNIDFGIWRRPNTNSDAITNPYIYNLYSISTPTSPFANIYDISAWIPKRATLFSTPVTSQSNIFVYTAVSSSTIGTLARARTINLTATASTTFAAGLAAGNAIFFLTPEGKYGMMLINAVTTDYDRKPYINVSVKVQN